MVILFIKLLIKIFLKKVLMVASIYLLTWVLICTTSKIFTRNKIKILTIPYNLFAGKNKRKLWIIIQHKLKYKLGILSKQKAYFFQIFLILFTFFYK